MGERERENITLNSGTTYQPLWTHADLHLILCVFLCNLFGLYFEPGFPLGTSDFDQVSTKKEKRHSTPMKALKATKHLREDRLYLKRPETLRTYIRAHKQSLPFILLSPFASLCLPRTSTILLTFGNTLDGPGAATTRGKHTRKYCYQLPSNELHHQYSYQLIDLSCCNNSKARNLSQCQNTVPC